MHDSMQTGMYVGVGAACTLTDAHAASLGAVQSDNCVELPYVPAPASLAVALRFGLALALSFGLAFGLHRCTESVVCMSACCHPCSGTLTRPPFVSIQAKRSFHPLAQLLVQCIVVICTFVVE